MEFGSWRGLTEPVPRIARERRIGWQAQDHAFLGTAANLYDSNGKRAEPFRDSEQLMLPGLLDTTSNLCTRCFLPTNVAICDDLALGPSTLRDGRPMCTF